MKNREKVCTSGAIHLWFLIAIGLFIATVASYVYLKSIWDSRLIAAKCEKRIRKNVNPEELQGWAVSMLKRYPGKNTDLFGKNEKLPACLTSVWDRGQPNIFVRGSDSTADQ